MCVRQDLELQGAILCLLKVSLCHVLVHACACWQFVLRISAEEAQSKKVTELSSILAVDEVLSKVSEEQHSSSAELADLSALACKPSYRCILTYLITVDMTLVTLHHCCWRSYRFFFSVPSIW